MINGREIFDNYNKIVELYNKFNELKQENEQLKEQIKKLKEREQYETCPYRSTDMGCDYCDWKDRDLKEEYEKELQEEMQQHEQRMFDLQCQNYNFDYGDVKY